MIVINRAILHILDLKAGVTVFSEQELNLKSESVVTFLTKHIERSLNDSNLNTGAFFENSVFKQHLDTYTTSKQDFIEFSTYISNLIYSISSKSDDQGSLDLIICDFNEDENRIIGILECRNRLGYVHQVIKDENKIKNDIINHYAILPNLSQKLDRCAFINLDTLNIKFIDKKTYIDGKDVFIIPDVVLGCNSSISSKDMFKLVSSITRKVAEDNGKSSAIAISKAKNYILENTEVSNKLEPIELGKQVFETSEAMQEEFIKEVESVGLPKTVNIDKAFMMRTGKNHKIKTDTGIEITFPVSYFENKEYIEFINNPNGTLSIELKNIGKIINK